MTKDEVMFKDISLNSVEDIYDFLWQLDFIHMQYQNGNEFAICLYNDFLDLIGQMEDYEEGLAKYINLYHDVQIGKVSLRGYENLSEKLGVTDIISLVTGEELKQIEERLHYEITEMYEFSKLTWVRINKNKYKDVNITYEDEKDEILHIDEEKLIKLDYMKKYTHHANRYKDDFKPSEIKELEEYRGYIKKRIKYVKDKMDKYKNKDNERYSKYKSVYSKLNSIEIQINKDISEIKRYYGISVGNQNKKGSTTRISYDANNNYILSEHDNKLKDEINKDYEKLIIKRDVEKISKIAEKNLTQRQLMIYKLYYENGLTQQEIADITGIFQPNVHRDIKNIINKLKSNL